MIEVCIPAMLLFAFQWLYSAHLRKQRKKRKERCQRWRDFITGR